VVAEVSAPEDFADSSRHWDFFASGNFALEFADCFFLVCSSPDWLCGGVDAGGVKTVSVVTEPKVKLKGFGTMDFVVQVIVEIEGCAWL